MNAMFQRISHRAIGGALLVLGSMSWQSVHAIPPLVGFLGVTNGNQLVQRVDLGNTTPWRPLGDAYTVTAMADYQGNLYVTSGNQLWQRGAVGGNSGNAWTSAGDAYAVVAMTVHQDHLYALSSGKLWQRGALGPHTGNSWTYAGDAPPGATTLTSFNGHFYTTAYNKLQRFDPSANGSGGIWTDVGDAYDVTALVTYQDQIYGLSHSQIWKRGTIGGTNRNDWTLVADASGITTFAAGIPVNGAHLTVCASSCDFTQIADAIWFAQPGDTVVIGAGRYPEKLVVDKDLTLQGAGRDSTILDGVNQVVDKSLIEVESNAHVVVNGLTVTRNGKSGDGGGILNKGVLHLSDCTVSENSTSEGFGGGISNTGTLSIERCEIMKNTCMWRGGGIMNTGTVQIAYSHIHDNPSPEYLRGVGEITSYTGTVSISKSTIGSLKSPSPIYVGIPDPNEILYPAGPIALPPAPSPATVSLENSTVLNNGSLNGLLGSVMVEKGANLILTNATFASTLAISGGVLTKNTLFVPAGTGTVCAFYGSGAMLSAGHNIARDSSCGLNGPTDRQNIPDVKIAPLQLNAPGITPTMALLPGSPAIDAGDCGSGIAFKDQRDIDRPQGAACDVGAYEWAAPPPLEDPWTQTTTTSPIDPSVIGFFR